MTTCGSIGLFAHDFSYPLWTKISNRSCSRALEMLRILAKANQGMEAWTSFMCSTRCRWACS
eukprot:753554-Hanusia_phi.AAC.3